MFCCKDGKIGIPQVLCALTLLSFVVLMFLAFQTTQVMRERGVLRQAYAQQDKPVDEAQKLQAQLAGLATGTAKLAQEGNKNAQAIVARLKEMGITIAPPSAEAPPMGAPGPRGSVPPQPPMSAPLPSPPAP